MSLGASLSLVLAGFIALLVTVVALSFRERRLGKDIAGNRQAQAASDARVMTVLFAAIPGGMLLTLITAWLVFF
jgi:hypothetical protein